MGHKTSSNKPEKCMMTCVPVFQVTKFALGLEIKENLGQIKEPGKSPLQFITARFIIIYFKGINILPLLLGWEIIPLIILEMIDFFFHFTNLVKEDITKSPFQSD